MCAIVQYNNYIFPPNSYNIYACMIKFHMYCMSDRLYKSLGDYDSLRGIFSSQVGTHSVTKETMEAEERGDYLDAVQKYKDAIGRDWEGTGPHQAEEDLWDDSLLEVGGYNLVFFPENMVFW